MTYEEALKYKQENTPNGEFVVIKGIEHRVMVVPLKSEDFSRYIDEEYDKRTTKDEDAIKYTSNGQFTVVALDVNVITGMLGVHSL